tara:strand:- start:3949 stop:4299 length:351 start_codon:yes stop_codon:yes gene_type:complete
MENQKKLTLDKLINLIKISEKKYKNGDFRGSFMDRMEIKLILESDLCDEETKEKFKGELSKIYISRFDLINDHKKKLDDIKRKKIINLLKDKSDDRFKKGDFKGALRALRRSEKYQ